MSWLGENKDRGRHPPKDEETGILGSLRSIYGEQGYNRILEAAEKAWETNQNIIGRDQLAGKTTPHMSIPEAELFTTPHMVMPETEHFTLPNGQPAVRVKVPKRYTLGIDLAAPMLDTTKVFIPGIENSRPGEGPEIRIKVRKHKLKFNFNN